MKPITTDDVRALRALCDRALTGQQDAWHLVRALLDTPIVGRCSCGRLLASGTETCAPISCDGAR